MVMRALHRPSIHLKGTPSVKWILGICVIENTLVDDKTMGNCCKTYTASLRFFSFNEFVLFF